MTAQDIVSRLLQGPVTPLRLAKAKALATRTHVDHQDVAAAIAAHPSLGSQIAAAFLAASGT